MDTLHLKYENLKENIRQLGSLAVAFSGGVDSTFLLYTARQVLGDQALAITAISHSFPEREMDEARNFCEKNDIRQICFLSEELSMDAFRSNPKNRCYICKHAIFSKVWEIARENGIPYLAEGSNMDDNGDYRPGLQAVTELGVLSPLRKAELYKEEIRALSKELGLPTWSKPSFACLASRFVYGETISEEKLLMVEKAEEFLLGKGFTQMRVRIHDKLARIELLPEDISRMLDDHLRRETNDYFKSLGFSYVSLDLLGYRTGSMNETLTKEQKEQWHHA